MQKTYYPKPGDVTREWYVVDAAGKNLGRVATTVARVLLGKGKPEFTPGVDVGDFVIVVNAEKLDVSTKKLDEKMYYRFSGYPGGLKKITMRQQMEKFPERVIVSAVKGMLPKNRRARALMKKLRIYRGSEHPHSAQNPKPLEVE
ncbi:MAG: 50S ribosomal protein L13 [Anaerolineales bacterium]|nr:50S ribosomal protein L13 [Anaerolineales bacterium]